MSILKALEKKTYLAFLLGDEVFGVDVQHVNEVLDFTTTTHVPGFPDFMRGIINLRGLVVPVVDMRLKFGMSETEKTLATCIIVLEVGFGENRTMIGALADSVSEVFEFEPGNIEPPPRLKGRNTQNFIQGIGKRGDQFILILNFNKVFSTDEVVLLDTAGSDESAVDEMPMEAGDDASGEGADTIS